MKKLNVNIEDIHIKGSPLLLTEVITSMDNSLQQVCQSTDDITNLVMRYSSSNKGKQYEKMANTLITLRDKMFEASVQLNEMQNQIVDYQNKVLRYEDMSESASAPNKFIVEKTIINVEQGEVMFRISEMQEISNGLNNYSISIYHNMQEIVRQKNDIAQFWQDTQYKDFAEFIDEISMEILGALKVFGEYITYLDVKMKELS